MVLEVRAELATRAKISPSSIRDWDLAYSGQWIQGSARLGWTETVHDRKVGRSVAIAKESYVL